MAEYVVKECPEFPFAEPKPKEIIRCKDCEYLRDVPCGDGIGVMKRCFWFESVAIMPYDFCSHGKKKKDCRCSCWLPGYGTPMNWKCSRCGEVVSFRTKYCPNCGADMRGAQNG